MVHLARIAQILVALFLIWLISVVIASQPDGLDFVASFLLVLLFWTVTTLILATLSERLFHVKEGEKRFSSSTAMLVITYIAMYLAPLSLLIRQRGITEPVDLILLIGQGIGFAFLITLIQLYVAKAIVSTLISIRNARHHKTDSS
ncbi:MAG: hypothetical protein KDB27_28060 [Planctomycetales bacterium]|nr:hypothetical protein [Planctomycetales bacterium]